MAATKSSAELRKAYSYTRFSTAEQAKGDSLRRQTALSERYAKEHGFTLDDKLTDPGLSAYKGANVTEGALGRFIKAVESGKVQKRSVLLVESLDRITRQDPLSALELFTKLLRLGLTVVTFQPSIEEFQAATLNSYKLMAAVLVLCRGHEESATKSARVRAAKAAERKAAIEHGTPMPGMLPAWVIRDAAAGKLKPHPEHTKIIKRIFREAEKGNGPDWIARKLNLEGVPCIAQKKSSNGWQPAYVRKILTQPAVIGVAVIEGKLVSNYYPVVIPAVLFYKVKDMRLSRRNPSGPKGHTEGNLFTGLARCSSCKSTMHKIDKGSRPRSKGGLTYLVCSNARRGNGCPYESWRLDDFELGVLTAIYHEVNWTDLGQRIEEHSAEELSRLEQTHSDLRLKLAKVELRLRGIEAEMEADLAEGHGTSPRLREQRWQQEKEEAALSRQIADTKERLSIEQDKAARAGVSADAAHEAFRDWLSRYSIAAGKKKSIPKKHGVTEEERMEARGRLKVILADLVQTIWCDSEEGEVYLVFRHALKEAVSVMLGGFTVFDGADG